VKFRHYVGQVIREIRQSHGLTLTDVSNFGHISLATISETERGLTNTSDEIVEVIADVLCVTVASIVLEASVRMSAASIPGEPLLRTNLSISHP
jgi:transcriptional regulator with XRE-family HTH domain